MDTDAGFLQLPVLPKDPVGVWRHVALSIQSGNMQVYENGNLVSTTTDTFSTISPTSTLRIGSGCCDPSEGRFFNGAIDEVKIFDIALDAQQICKESKTTITPDLDSDGLPDFCDPENIITESKTITISHTLIGDVIVQDGAVLTVSSTGSVSIPSSNNLIVKSGSGLLILSGGKVSLSG